MQKHTLLILGFTFLTGWSQAQIADTTLRNLALRKLNQFGKILELAASPGLNQTTKINLEQKLEADFLENSEVRFYQDLNYQFGHAQQIAAHQYFNQLRVLYPNGASLLTNDFEASDVFFDPSRDMYYIMVRCQRNFKGLNALAKKEVSVTKVIDYQVKLMESGVIKIQILGSHLAEGNLNTPIGIDKSVEELKKNGFAAKASPVSENQMLAANEKVIDDTKIKLGNYQDLKEATEERQQSQGKTKTEKKNEKLKAHLEQMRLKNEIRQAKRERDNLYPTRFNIRVGGGVFLSDSTVNAIFEPDLNKCKENWNVKLDLLYKFAGLHRNSKGKWERAHALGFFFNYGKQSGRNAYNLIKSPEHEFQVDTLRPAQSFMEAEFGFMIKEQLRLSAGGGVMNYNRLTDGVLASSSQPYLCLTTGLSPRFFGLFELDLNLSGLVIGDRLYARANANLVILIKAGKF